jgi:hypothetical protein
MVSPRLLPGSHLLAGGFYSVRDVLVTGATAQVTGYGFEDFLIAWILVCLEEGDECHQETGSAISALQGMFLMECFLKGMQIIWSAQAFDGANLMPVGLGCKDQARAHRETIEDDGAGAAYAVFTADMRTRQSQVMAQEVTQEKAGFNIAFVDHAIHGCFDMDSFHG